MSNTQYTVVEPYTEILDPNKLGYLDLIELAARNCHKSEADMETKDQGDFLNRVCFKYGHHSVTDHATCLMDITVGNTSTFLAEVVGLYESNPSPSRGLFALRASVPRSYEILRLSGNVKMWTDLVKEIRHNPLVNGIRGALHVRWPFFFPEAANVSPRVELLDENPLTNKNDLSPEEMRRHMTLTHRFVGDRAMSHQLVRHRLAAYSQESQRYCDYGKKGFQFIIPPEYQEHALRQRYIDQALSSYDFYLESRKADINKEDARRNLPNCTKTDVITTYTLGIWNYFHGHRSFNKAAEWCIRELGQSAYADQAKLLPHVLTVRN